VLSVGSAAKTAVDKNAKTVLIVKTKRFSDIGMGNFLIG
jgi:hypothetical protein